MVELRALPKTQNTVAVIQVRVKTTKLTYRRVDSTGQGSRNGCTAENNREKDSCTVLVTKGPEKKTHENGSANASNT